MFTGIIEHLGRVKAREELGSEQKLVIHAEGTFSDVKNGESIAVNGVCLTVVSFTPDEAVFMLGPETIKRSNLGFLKPDDTVNLEFSLRMNDRLGGHFVQGHVDDTAEIVHLETEGTTMWMTVRLPESARPYLAAKGSIAINGVSLTIAKKDELDISIMLMDYTLVKTNLSEVKLGDRLNVEYDFLAKLVHEQLKQAQQ